MTRLARQQSQSQEDLDTSSASIAIEATPARAAELRRLLRGYLSMEGGEPPDCVLVVHEPPAMDALAELSKLSGPEGLPRTAVVVVSRVADRHFRRAALRAGAMEVVEGERLEPEALSAAVEEAIERFSVVRRSSRPTRGPSGLEERLRATFEHAAVGMAHLDVEGRFLAVNPAFSRLTGYGVEELASKTLAEITHPDDVEADGSHERRLLAGDVSSYCVEKRCIRKDGATVWVNLCVALAREASTGRPFLIAVTHDVNAKRAAEREQRKLLALVEHSGDFIATADLDGRLTYLNTSGRRMIGIGAGDDIGALHFTDYVPESWRDFFRDTVIGTARKQGLWQGEMRLCNLASGKLLDVFRTTFLLRDPDTGEPWCYATVTHDVTERRDAEAALRRSEEAAREGERFALRVINNLFAFVGVLDTSGTLLDANEAPLAAAGIDIEEVRGKKFWDCYWWSYADEVSEALRLACERAARGEVVRYDAIVRMAGDMRMTIDFQVAPLRDAQGQITHLVPSAVDITERKRAEQELKRSEARFRRLFETNLLGILFWDLHGGVHDANDEFLRMVGYDRADLASGVMDWSRMTPPEHRGQDERAVEELRRTGKHAPIEKEFIRKDGSTVWVLVGSAITEGENGVGFVLDISRQKQGEAALRVSEHRAREEATRAEAERGALDAILEAAPAGIILADANGRIVRVNAANERLWGPAPMAECVEEYREWKGYWADPSERQGRRIEPNEWAMTRALRGEIARNDVVEIEPFDRPGTRRTVVNSGAPVRDAEGHITGAVIVQMDITALVATEAARRESEARFRDLADNIAQLAWMTDETGAIFWYNRRWFEFTGTTLEEMKGWGWQKVHHPAHVERVTEKFRRHIASGEPWEDTFPLRSASGEYRWFLSRAFPLRDDAGRIVSWFGTNTDVTAQREAEEALREADRRKDEFIAILAHELRNPLAPVRNAVEILRRLGPMEPRLQRTRDIIDRQVSHMARLIDDLLDVSRIARGKLALQNERCDLAAIVRQTAEDYRPSVESVGLSLVVSGSASSIWVEGDPVRLAQMIGNLLHNAVRFTDTGGRVEVRTEADVGSRLALVSVVDTGVGIEPALQSRLFDPFSQADQDLARTKGGLGLGLALTKGLVELHGGQVTAYSEGSGRGSTFTLRIPLRKARDAAASEDGSASGGEEGLRILIVEDNRDAAETLGELLELEGHEVKIAFNGAAAVAAAREFHPRVVISDIGLPGQLDGYAIARALRAERALEGVYLIALSGYADEEARRRSREAGFNVHFAKPPNLAALELALASIGRARLPPGR